MKGINVSDLIGLYQIFLKHILISDLITASYQIVVYFFVVGLFIQGRNKPDNLGGGVLLMYSIMFSTINVF